MKNDNHERYKPKKIKYCSFCGRSEHEINHLIEGPSVYICNKCIDECNYIIKKGKQSSDNEKDEKK